MANKLIKWMWSINYRVQCSQTWHVWNSVKSFVNNVRHIFIGFIVNFLHLLQVIHNQGTLQSNKIKFLMFTSRLTLTLTQFSPKSVITCALIWGAHQLSAIQCWFITGNTSYQLNKAQTMFNCTKLSLDWTCKDIQMHATHYNSSCRRTWIEFDTEAFPLHNQLFTWTDIYHWK